MTTETTRDVPAASGAPSEEQLAKIMYDANDLSWWSDFANVSADFRGAYLRMARAVRAALTPAVAPLAPGETVTIRDAVYTGDAARITLEQHDETPLLAIGPVESTNEVWIFLDAAGVAALKLACMRWDAGQEGT